MTTADDMNANHTRVMPEGIPMSSGARTPGSVFHDFHLLGLCGRGGFGEVWRVEDISGKVMALKIVSKKLLGHHWLREFTGIKNFRKLGEVHPNLVQIYHVGEDEENFYYSMELADSIVGTQAEYEPLTLASLLETGRLLPDRIVELALQLLDGIETLHQAQMAHRDIKPANIIFVRGIPKLSDVGLVASLDPSMSFAGTPGFIPPEELMGQSNGKTKELQSDLYALGKVIYCAMTGNPPGEFPNLPADITLLGLNKKLNRLVCLACNMTPSARLHSATRFRQLLLEMSGKPGAAATVEPVAPQEEKFSWFLCRIAALSRGFNQLNRILQLLIMIGITTTVLMAAAKIFLIPKESSPVTAPAAAKQGTTTEPRPATKKPAEAPAKAPFSGTITIIGLTASNRDSDSPSMTLYGTVNSNKEKITLCTDKELSRQKLYIFPLPVKEKKIDSVTLTAAGFDGWEAEWFTFKLPDGTVWRFAGAGIRFSSRNDEKPNDCRQSVTFYFTGDKAGTIVGSIPDNRHHRAWESQVKGHIAVTVPPAETVNSQQRQCFNALTISGYSALQKQDWQTAADAFRQALKTDGFENNEDAIAGLAAAVNELNVKTAVTTAPVPGQNWIIPGLGMTMIYVAPGAFPMGSVSLGHNNERPVHQVKISRGYWIGQCEVTRTEYAAITNPGNPGNSNSARFPMTEISWDEATAYCQALNGREKRAGRLPEGYVYRLPTEAEWEYAARGGNKSMDYLYSGGNDINQVSWNSANAGKQLHPAGLLKPNELGICDMSGNVWEWCADWFGDFSVQPQLDPQGPSSGSARVVRGGGFFNPAFTSRVTRRSAASKSGKNIGTGFRVVLGKELASPPPAQMSAPVPTLPVAAATSTSNDKSQTQQETVKALLEAGNTSLQRRNWSEAEKMFQTILEMPGYERCAEAEFGLRMARNRYAPRVTTRKPTVVTPTVKHPLPGHNWIVPGLGMQLIYVPPGTFTMGSNPTKETQLSQVTLTRGYWIGRCEVNQQEYLTLMHANPSFFDEIKGPVDQVSWHEATAFCNALTGQENQAGRLPQGYAYRLPTEAEWEYAARGGNKSKNFLFSGSNEVNAVGWNIGNSFRTTHATGSLQANELGICDMSGNVWEWCNDWYEAYKSSAFDPHGPTAGKFKVIRGGCFNDREKSLGAAYRHATSPARKVYTVGFRVVLAPLLK